MTSSSNTPPADGPAERPTGRRKRSAARLAAVQALYRIGLTGDPLTQVIANFEEHPVAETSDDALPVDLAYYRAVVTGVGDRHSDLDSMIDGALDTGRSLRRMELVLAAILRAGTLELISREDLDAPILITEYVHIAEAFFDGPEPKLVNAVLDRIAKTHRDGELAAARERRRAVEDAATGADLLLAGATNDAAAPDGDEQ